MRSTPKPFTFLKRELPRQSRQTGSTRAATATKTKTFTMVRKENVDAD